jgi:hypothetical protein
LKPFTKVAVAVFALVAALHLVRLLARWDVIVNGIAIPLWLSGAGLIVAAGLAIMVWREARG